MLNLIAENLWSKPAVLLTPWEKMILGLQQFGMGVGGLLLLIAAFYLVVFICYKFSK